MTRSFSFPFSVSVRVQVLVASALLAALALVGPAASPAGAVAHGEVAADGAYPFNARLAMTVTMAGFRFTTVCSGALVAPSWVITAGHCFVDAQGQPVSGPVPYPTTATIGRTDVMGGDGRRRPVNVVEVEQAPDGTDIALLRLAQPVAGATTIALSTRVPAVGTTLRIAGWGSTSALPFPSARLHTGLVSITSVTGTTVGVTGLSPARDTSACLYDSGAPYFTEGPEGPRLAAVESDGPTCPHDQEETTARVDTVAVWIRATIKTSR